MITRQKNFFPLILILLSLVVQLGFLLYLFDPASFFYKYWELAQRLRGVVAPPIEVFYSSPFYISLLALLQTIRLTYLDVKILQAIIGAINCWLIYRAGITFFDRSVARIAGLAAVFYHSFILYNLSILPAVWVITFNLLALVSLAEYFQGRKLSRLIISGLAIGFSIITRPNFTIFPLLLVPYLLMSGKSRVRNVGEVSNLDAGRPGESGLKSPPSSGLENPTAKRNARGPIFTLKTIFLLLVPALAVILPVSLFNYAGSGSLIPVTASGGWVFYCSNNPRVKGFDFSPPPEFDRRLGYYYSSRPELNYVEHLLSLELARERSGKKLSPGEASRYWRNRGAEFIREDPRLYLKLLGKKMIAALNGYEGHDVCEVMQRNHRLKAWPLLTAGVVLPLAFLGIIIARPRLPGILYLYLLSYLISFLIMYVTPRFRLPAVPVLLLFGAAAVMKLLGQLKRKRWKGLGLNLLLLLTLAVLVNFSPPDIRKDREINRPAFLYEWRGLTLMRREKWEEAAQSFKKALELRPDSFRSRSNLELINEGSADGD